MDELIKMEGVGFWTDVLIGNTGGWMIKYQMNGCIYDYTILYISLGTVQAGSEPFP